MMIIYWDNVPQDCEDMLEKLAKRTLEYVSAPQTAEVSISFVEAEEIQQLNKEYRNKDSVTDVLSFPFTEVGEWETQGNVPIALGDIMICSDVAHKQAEEYGHSYERELSFLLVHGLLHLAGYDHQQPEDEQEMRSVQRTILNEGVQI